MIVFSKLLTVVLAISPAFVGAPDNDLSRYIVGGFTEEESWANLSSLDVDTAGGFDLANELERVPTAASRAALRAPALEICPDDENIYIANGARQITIKEVVYHPLKSGTFSKSSSYGWRFHPVLGTYKKHEGTDYSATTGTALYSVADGVVVKAEYDSNRGNYVTIKHSMSDGSVWFSQYLHQPYLEVSVGQVVSAGDRIGSVGSTGLSTGPHLHFEVLNSEDEHLDPEAWLSSYGAIFVGEDC